MASAAQLVSSGNESTALLSGTSACKFAPRPAELASEVDCSVARRRYQQGRIFMRGRHDRRVFVGRWRADVIQADGTIRRIERSIVLGPISELKTKKNAQRSFEPILAEVNSPSYRPGKFAKFREFADTWESQVLIHQKPSSVKSAQSHLKTYIRKWLGEVRLEDFTPQAQQNFVTRLSQKVSRKTLLNVLGTISSMLRTAKSWGYCCYMISTNDLALPAERVSRSARFFTADQVRKIIALASEPYRTMFAIAAMTGLRAGEIVGLQVSDLDFEQRAIHVNRSAWFGRVQTVKSKASRAPVAMPELLVTILKEFLVTWRDNPERFLFLNRRGRPYSQSKVVERRLHPILDKLNIPRAGMHAFRHCHASLLLDVGAPPTVAKEQLRHSDARITLGIYGHVIGDAQRSAVEKVGEMFRPMNSGANGTRNCAQLRPN